MALCVAAPSLSTNAVPPHNFPCMNLYVRSGVGAGVGVTAMSTGQSPCLDEQVRRFEQYQQLKGGIVSCVAQQRVVHALESRRAELASSELAAQRDADVSSDEYAALRAGSASHTTPDLASARDWMAAEQNPFLQQALIRFRGKLDAVTAAHTLSVACKQRLHLEETMLHRAVALVRPWIAAAPEEWTRILYQSAVADACIPQAPGVAATSPVAAATMAAPPEGETLEGGREREREISEVLYLHITA